MCIESDVRQELYFEGVIEYFAVQKSKKDCFFLLGTTQVYLIAYVYRYLGNQFLLSSVLIKNIEA